MTIRPTNADTYFDLPENLQLSVELNSPFFAEQGSFTLPFTLPDTVRNRQLLGFANRLDTTYSVELDVIAAIGTWHTGATLILLSHSKQGFECSLLLGISKMYRLFRNVTLRQALKNYVWTTTQGRCDLTVTTPQRSTPRELLNHLLDANHYEPTDTAAIKAQDKEDFAFFPVMAEEGILNAVMPDFEYWRYAPWDIPDENVQCGGAEAYDLPFHFGDRYIRFNDNGVNSKALGFTAFLRLKTVLELVFKSVGLNFQLSIGTTDSNLDLAKFRQIVVLNSTVDALAPGMIYYSTLVPDMLVTDFLKSMFAMFGMAFFEQFNRNLVYGKVLNKRFTDRGSLVNSGNYVISGLQYGSPQDLSIAFNHLGPSDDKEMHSLDDLRNAGFVVADPIPNYEHSDRRLPGRSLEQEISLHDVPGVIRVIDRGELYNTTIIDTTTTPYTIKADLVGYDQLDLTPIAGMQTKSLDNSLSDTRPVDTYEYYRRLQQAGFELEWIGDYPAPYVGPVNAETSEIVVTVSHIDEQGTETTSQQTLPSRTGLPLLLCYCHSTPFEFFGQDRWTDEFGKRNMVMPFGSPYAYTPSRYATTEIYHQATYFPQRNLTATGMAATMHENYRQLLRSGERTLVITTMLTQEQILKFNFSTVKNVENHSCLPIKLEAAIGSNAQLIPVQITLLVL